MNEASPPWRWPRAAYVHIPFCAHHCGYCDFAVSVGTEHRVELYLDALAAEMRILLDGPAPVRTLFVGGGTPSHLSAGQLARLFETLRRWLPAAGGEYECTVEANPDSLTDEKIAVLADAGVTRISLGAQSFHPHLLRMLDRNHDAAEVPRAVARVRRRIAQVSLDLIFGAPGQTEAEWLEDLRQALALEPDHLSTYGLTYEKGTPLWKRRQRGDLTPLDEDAELSRYITAIDVLEAAGFEQYEISNFAKPGKRCRHNETYWANEAYFGFGMGAARYVMGKRELNTRDLERYLRQTLSGEAATFQSEELTGEERAKETMAVQLRRTEGVERQRFREQTGCDLDETAGAAIARHVELGLLQDDGCTVRLTRRGRYVADGVIERLL